MTTLASTLQNKPTVRKIRAKNPELAEAIINQSGFIRQDQVDALIAVDRLLMVLVRCGCGRFLCPVQNLKHLISIIEEHAKLKEEKTGQPMQGDYVRDVSLPAE